MSLGNHDDDFFSDSRMSFGDHLEDLRLHLWRTIAGFCVAMVMCFFVSKSVLAGLIIAPVESQLQIFYDRRADEIREERGKQTASILEELGEKGKPQPMHVWLPRKTLEAIRNGDGDPPLIEDPRALPDQDWVQIDMRLLPLEVSTALAPVLQKLGPRPSMKTMDVTEAFMVYFKVSIVCGLILSSPWVFWQLWMFVAAGLYPHEKRYVHVYLPFSLGLFLSGAMICQFIVLPRTVEALLWFNRWLDLDPDLRLNEWLGFAIWMPIVFGVSFQTPLVMLFLYRIGIFDIETYKAKQRIAFFIMAILAAVLTPSVDAVSMLFLWVPMCGLYMLGIWLCQWSPRQSLEIDEPDELIEV